MTRAFWKASTLSVAALLALALVTQTSEPRRAEASVGPNIASQAVVLMTSVTNPLGVSSYDLNVMRDGFSGPNAFQYDTWDGANAAAGEDYYGYGWAAPQQVARVMFTEGSVFPDGGFFTTLRLESSPDGVTWTTVAGGNDASPPYPNANDGVPFSTYQWDFIPAISTRYLRVIGAAGGSAEFTSVSEFQVFTSGGVVPVDNIAPYADFVGTNAAAPTGNGARDLNVLRDGIKPAPGSFNPSLQYDTNTGAPNPAEVYFLYRWPSQRTITRIEFYGGQETAEGGWWTDLRIELSSNGNDWNPMKTAADAVPVYPNAASQSFNHYTFTFATPRSGKYMRIIGPAGGTPGYVSASEIEVYAELEPGEGGYYPNIAPSAAEIFGSHNAGVGQGAPSLTVINDGYAPGVDAVEPLAQFDTWNGFNTATEPDFYAYRFATTKVFTGAAYTEGMQFTDGGWFAGGPHIEVSNDGATWTPVAGTISPAYVDDDGHNFNRYAFTFAAPVTGLYVRLVGPAGGASEFTSVSEFEVYGGNLTTTNSVDLRLTQTVDDAAPAVGDTVTFTVTLSSHNATTATGVTVADALPGGVTLVSATPSAGTYAAGVWSVPTLAGNTNATLTLTVTVDPGTETQTITNTALFSTANEVNIGSPLSAASSIIVAGVLGDPNIAPLANLLITSVPAPLGGGNHNLEIIRDLSYPVSGTNDPGLQYDTWDAWTPNGPDYFGYRWPNRYHFTGIKFVDGMHFGDGGFFNEPPVVEVSDDGVTWTAVATIAGYQGNLAPNFTAYPVSFTADGRYLRVIGTPAGSAEFTSIAELEVYGTILPTAPNVNVTVDATPGNPTVGGSVTITVTVANTGDGDATGIVIDSPIPTGMTLVSATPDQGTYGAGSWTLGALPAGATRTLVLVVTMDTGTGGQTITHTATITQMTEPNPGKRSDSASVTVQAPLGDPNIAPLANLLITSVPAPLGGGNHNLEIIRDLSYPVPGTNDAGQQYDTFDFFAPSGPDYFGYRWPNRYHITGIKFVDGMHFFDGGFFTEPPVVEVSDDGITWTAVATIAGYQGTVAPNFTAYPVSFTADGRYLRVIGTPAGGAEFTSIAELEVYGTVLPGSPNVNITVTGVSSNPLPGNTATITVTATNIGDAGATGILINSPVPAGLTLVSATPTQGSYTGGNWTLGNLPAGATQALVLVVTIDAGTGGQAITHTATITQMTEPNPGNGTASATLNIGIPGTPVVNITVTVDNPSPQVGQNVTITITATNVGTAGATGVSVPWTLPVGLTLVSTTPGTGSPWNVGSLAVSEAKTLVIVATVTGSAGQPLVVNAGPLTMDQPNTGAGTGSVTITPTAPLAPIVNITVTVDNPSPQVGQNVTITITATNVGTAGATGVSVPWALPTGLTLVSTTPSTGSPWNVGNLAVNQVKTLVIIATVTGAAGQPLVVNAGPLTMDQPNTGTGTGSVTITPAAAPASPGWMNVGGNIGSGNKKDTWGGTISCDGVAKKSFEYQDHQNVRFKLATVTSVTCSTTPGVSQGQPRAGFNTLVLHGTSSDGKRVEATFIDAGEPGRNDTVNIKVFSSSGSLISSVNGELDGGNLQAHAGGEGYDSQGYDSEGYDHDGYDRAGYDRDGCDRSGRDRSGRDRGGRNRHDR